MYKLLIIGLLLIIVGLINGLTYARMQLEYLNGQYSDFITLTDKAMNGRSAIILDNTCFNQLTNANMIQIKIIK